MKKVLVLLALVVITSSGTHVQSTPASQLKMAAGSVPEAVIVGFESTTADVMNNWYPGNSGWDESNVSWNHYKGDWVCTGNVLVSGGNGNGINIVEAHYKNTGEFISYNYNVLP